MDRFSVATVLMTMVVCSTWASEPKSVQLTKKSAPRVQANEFQRVLARLAARDRAIANDVAKLLVRPQPEWVQFLINRHERQTGGREDVFVGAKLPFGPPRGIADRIAEIAVCPTKLIARHFDRYLPTIPLLQRIEVNLKQKAELRREVLRNLTLFTSPQPQFGRYLMRYSADPNVRMMQLLNESEDLRQAGREMKRFWMNNQPSVLRYERLNGAIGP